MCEAQRTSGETTAMRQGRALRQVLQRAGTIQPSSAPVSDDPMPLLVWRMIVYSFRRCRRKTISNASLTSFTPHYGPGMTRALAFLSKMTFDVARRHVLDAKKLLACQCKDLG